MLARVVRLMRNKETNELVAMKYIERGRKAINCVDVDVALRQCVPYITGQAPNPAKGCCDGIGHIKSIATTKADRQAACGCMKAAASHLPGIVDSAVTALPAKCNVPLPYPISASVDCSK
ncbi:uncharacterized protein A4U43_C07F34440 [Asparagus officinalis]|uniref:Non-specific lipid-transfer protein n=1 Tax=Asparagus officinalis TaxID=4686 RepID=A0A5P1EHG6_ASPOF|nr:uncharacterized protein A4U43_C07F34440 [Asparagus officinalis]